MAIVFPFSVDDKESNSSSGGDGKAKSSSTTASASNNSNNSATKNSNFNDGTTTTDKANSTNKPTTPPSSSATTPNSDQTVTNCAKSAESVSEQAKCNPTTRAKNCDALSDVMNNVIDTSGIKVEIKDDPDAPKVTKSVNNIQPALGGSLLPSHAANAKHPVSIYIYSLFVSCLGEFEDSSNGSKLYSGEGVVPTGDSPRECIRSSIKSNLNCFSPERAARCKQVISVRLSNRRRKKS